MDYNSGLRSRHCQGEHPAGGQGRAIELPVAHRGVPLRECGALLLPGQGQGRGARGQGQPLEEEPRPRSLGFHPKSDYTLILAFRILINKSQTVKLAVYRFLSVEEAPRLKGFSLCLVLKQDLGVRP